MDTIIDITRYQNIRSWYVKEALSTNIELKLAKLTLNMSVSSKNGFKIAEYVPDINKGAL